MNEWKKNLYSALKSLQMYAQSTALNRELKTKTKPMSKRKTFLPGVREISPVSIYGEVYGEKDLRKRCVLSLA